MFLALEPEWLVSLRSCWRDRQPSGDAVDDENARAWAPDECERCMPNGFPSGLVVENKTVNEGLKGAQRQIDQGASGTHVEISR